MLTKGPHGLGKVVPSASRDRERSRRRARSTQAPADAAPDVTSEVRFWTANYAERLRSIPVPFLVWDMLAVVAALHPDPPLTRDQVKLMKRDNVVGKQALTLEDLGIRPIPVEEVLPECIGVTPS